MEKETVTLIGGTNDGLRIEVDTKQNFIIMYCKEQFSIGKWEDISKIHIMKRETYLRRYIAIGNKEDLNNPTSLWYFQLEGMENIHAIELLLGNYKRNCIER